ncbi:MAG: class II glutamine amidotransferase, partial [Arthrobacter sp.]
ELSAVRSVLFATEPMNHNPGWRPLSPGELVHVGPDLAVTCALPLPDQPAHPLTLADLEPSAAASQTS